MTADHNTDHVETADVMDRRNSNRVSYDSTLGFAVLSGRPERVPERERFTLVHGSDFSHTGISFTTGVWPASDQLVLMLNTQLKTVYAVARVVGCVAQRRAGADVSRFEVRCEFERWLDA